MKGCIIIPTFNESKIIYRLILDIKKFGLDVLVIDDGSSDGTAELAKNAGAQVITHSKNRGKGASLRTGFQKVIKDDYDFIITMDGDGQHRPQDIPAFVEHFTKYNTDIIVGNRMDEPKNMPFHRWITNKVMSMLISSVCKAYIPDTQCGFRLIKASALKDMVFSTSNYEIESELLIQASKKKYIIENVDIRTIYDGQISQINPIIDTIRFFRFLLKDFIREGWFILKEFFNDAVIKHGSVIFLSSALFNVLSLIFWLFMVRKLSHVDYGTLNTMASFLNVAGLPTIILQTVLAKYFSEFKAQDKKREIQVLFHAFLKRILFLNTIIAFSFLLLAGTISRFLNLENSAFIYLSLFYILFTTLWTLAISTLQGLQLFPRIALNAIIQGFIKLFVGVVLVLTGFRAMGAFLGFIFAAFGALILSLFQLPSWLLKIKKKEYLDFKSKIKLIDIYNYFLPVSLALISYTLFINSDMILVKHFFDKSNVGIYSIAQTVGKMILFLPVSITFVLFPATIQQKALNKNTVPLLKKSLLFVASLCILAVLFTFTFPKFILRVTSGRILPECIPLVRLIIFPMSLFALNYILIVYNLSLNNIGFIVSILIISIIQIIFIYLLHNTLFEVVGILFISSLLVFYLGIRNILKEKQYE